MEDKWITAYETDRPYQAEIIKAVLCDNGVEAFILNQKDSSYVMIGTVKVIINEKDRDKASAIIKSADCE